MKIFKKLIGNQGYANLKQNEITATTKRLAQFTSENIKGFQKQLPYIAKWENKPEHSLRNHLASSYSMTQQFHSQVSNPRDFFMLYL